MLKFFSYIFSITSFMLNTLRFMIVVLRNVRLIRIEVLLFGIFSIYILNNIHGFIKKIFVFILFQMIRIRFIWNFLFILYMFWLKFIFYALWNWWSLLYIYCQSILLKRMSAYNRMFIIILLSLVCIIHFLSIYLWFDLWGSRSSYYIIISL